jgi:hypothetical protein
MVYPTKNRSDDVFSNLSMHAGSLDMFRPNLYWNLTAPQESILSASVLLCPGKLMLDSPARMIIPHYKI